MKDRSSKRRGRASTVSGSPADEVLADLVGQFADPYAFVRELVQNSLDAGAMGIDIELSWRSGTWTIVVSDDGEGMDRATIEGYLLTLFRSTKEEDRTKIGKFGIGFVSLFAMEPDRVVVDTGRDGLWHRILFDAKRAFTLLEQDDPFEGTTVTLEIRCSRAEARERGALVRASAHRWCRFADGSIRLRDNLTTNGWQTLHADVDFADAPVSVQVEEDGLRLALAPDPGARAPGIFLGQGLVLWSGETSLVPGARFIARSRLLEHTLTRDDVKRDAGYRHVLARMRAAASERLGPAVHEALHQAAVACDLDALHRLGETLPSKAAWSWDYRRPLLPAVAREPVALGELGSWGGWLKRVVGRAAAPLLVGTAGSAIARRLAQDGQVVLVGMPTHGHIEWVANLLEREVVDITDHYLLPTPAEPGAADALLEAAQTQLRRLRSGLVVHSASFAGGGSALDGRLAITQNEPFGLVEVAQGHGAAGGHLLIDVSHPLVHGLLQRPLGAASLVLAATALAEVGVAVQVPASRVLDVVEAP